MVQIDVYLRCGFIGAVKAHFKGFLAHFKRHLIKTMSGDK